MTEPSDAFKKYGEAMSNQIAYEANKLADIFLGRMDRLGFRLGEASALVALALTGTGALTLLIAADVAKSEESKAVAIFTDDLVPEAIRNARRLLAIGTAPDKTQH